PRSPARGHSPGGCEEAPEDGVEEVGDVAPAGPGDEGEGDSGDAEQDERVLGGGLAVLTGDRWIRGGGWHGGPPAADGDSEAQAADGAGEEGRHREQREGGE